MNVIGNGVVVHVPSLFEEIQEMQDKGIQVGLGFWLGQNAFGIKWV